MIDRFGLLPQPVKHLFAVTELKLKALPLGIRKIDAGSQSGRIRFGEDPQVDPARLVQLIQAEPRSYRLDGGDTLRFNAEMPDAETRLQVVSELLDRLQE